MLNKFDMKLTQKLLKQYKKASKKQKGQIIDQYCSITNIKRKTAIKRFNRAGLNPYPRIFKKIKIKKKRGAKIKYGYVQKKIIKQCWELSGKVCAEKLHPMLQIYIQQLEDNFKLREYTSFDIERTKQISVATLKRIIAEFPKQQKGRCKGNSVLYKTIPIIANFGRYAHLKPGLIEVDFVVHSGVNNKGPYAITGCFIDIYSQWISRGACLGKNQEGMRKIVEITHKKIYHPIYHYHPDNDKAILKVLFSKVQRKQDNRGRDGDGDNNTNNSKNKNPIDLPLSRSRPYMKNDNAHVEQKNYDKVRRLVGYYRYDSLEEVELLNRIYNITDLIDNFFIASFKLKKKIINNKGRVIKKVYHQPETPYQRLKSSSFIKKEVKQKLEEIYKRLNLVKLREELTQLLDQLSRLQKMKNRQKYIIDFRDKNYDPTRDEKQRFRRHLIMS